MLYDKVCVDPFSFLMITDQKGLPTRTVDGILGLAMAGSTNA